MGLKYFRISTTLFMRRSLYIRMVCVELLQPFHVTNAACQLQSFFSRSFQYCVVFFCFCFSSGSAWRWMCNVCPCDCLETISMQLLFTISTRSASLHTESSPKNLSMLHQTTLEWKGNHWKYEKTQKNCSLKNGSGNSYSLFLCVIIYSSS